MPDSAAEIAVLDASLLVEVLAGTSHADAARERLRGAVLHAPAHFDAEVLSALGRLQRAGELTPDEVAAALDRLTSLPLTRHPVAELAAGAWSRRADLRLTDALYVELAARLRTVVLTTDRRLARATTLAEEIG
ncbi:type II toxin-antitoxin system VapC family toxin [Amycolatopsis jiangsuensis]|uniref:Ribonuclease VapC n=1 Tax=Amycolatopsis jiangsuensis TaxID=1181879 RepID=A0A840IYL5_9PSEU|nr:type II toxin-antitoxin system VapC family toxin [Amycolatopsis jiangsuensis]MBB4686599.1 putative nucleic acid-binding protein [Amycolatopsis jiangsuensis]